MILEEIADGLNPNVLFHCIDYNFYDFAFIFCVENLAFTFEQHTHTIQRKNFKRFHADDAIKHQEELFDWNITYKAVKNPGKN